MNWRPGLLRSVCFWQCAGLVCFSLFNTPLAHAITASKAVEKGVRVYLNPNTGRFWTMDSYEGNQSEPLSLHKYLYCRSDPGNRLDPSGNIDFVELIASMSLREKITVLVGVAVYVGVSINSHVKGEPPTDLQQARIDAAIKYLDDSRVPPDLRRYASRARDTKFRIVKSKDAQTVLGKKYYATNRPTSLAFLAKIIYLNEDSFGLDDRLLASSILHESVHINQWFGREKEAYQAESDFLKSIGVTGAPVDV